MFLHLGRWRSGARYWTAGDSPGDYTAFASYIDTYPARLLAQAISRIVYGSQTQRCYGRGWSTEAIKGNRGKGWSHKSAHSVMHASPLGTIIACKELRHEELG
jgi:hypothetical protein